MCYLVNAIENYCLLVAESFSVGGFVETCKFALLQFITRLPPPLPFPHSDVV